eukprot:scaffold86_cov338-Pavlova_lutheri.AAC.80
MDAPWTKAIAWSTFLPREREVRRRSTGMPSTRREQTRIGIGRQAVHALSENILPRFGHPGLPSKCLGRRWGETPNGEKRKRQERTGKIEGRMTGQETVVKCAEVDRPKKA